MTWIVDKKSSLSLEARCLPKYQKEKGFERSWWMSQLYEKAAEAQDHTRELLGWGRIQPTQLLYYYSHF